MLKLVPWDVSLSSRSREPSELDSLMTLLFDELLLVLKSYQHCFVVLDGIDKCSVTGLSLTPPKLQLLAMRSLEALFFSFPFTQRLDSIAVAVAVATALGREGVGVFEKILTGKGDGKLGVREDRDARNGQLYAT